MNHLYSYFGILLGCSNVTKPGFSDYQGETSMYEVHKFMELDSYEVGYFIQQVGSAAAALGVAGADVDWVEKALQDYFGMECSAATSVLPDSKKELQSICIAVRQTSFRYY
jgi:hypothetical protein